MRLAREIAAGVVESFRETLPSTEDEAGWFMSGLAWGFVLFWTIMIVGTFGWAFVNGARL